MRQVVSVGSRMLRHVRLFQSEKNQVNQIFLHCVVNWLTFSQKKEFLSCYCILQLKLFISHLASCECGVE